MKIMKRLLFFLLSTMLMVSCKQYYDAIASVDIKYENKTKYNIEITDLEWRGAQYIEYDKYENNITLTPGSCHRGAQMHFMTNEPLSSRPSGTSYYPSAATIWFNGEYVVRIEADANTKEDATIASLINPANYKDKVNGKFGWTLTYTFTDADYEYAVENGQRVTEE